MKTPFPYFGNKGRIAAVIWERFGNPSYYYEPFGGSMACLLNRPESTTRTRYEHVGDSECMIANFFRAAKFANPVELARLADWPNSQIDLVSRAEYLAKQRGRLHDGLMSDPKWYDIECAAWYAWMMSVKISTHARTLVLGRTAGLRRKNQDLTVYFWELAERLKDVAIYYGDWTVLANAANQQSKECDCAILLDPPYKYTTGRQAKLYETDSADVAGYVQRWALAVSVIRPKLRIALCGLAGEHKMPADWEELAWATKLGKGKERIWFSPNCLKPTTSIRKKRQMIEH